VGIVAPRGAPAEIVETLNRKINAGLIEAKVKAWPCADADGRGRVRKVHRRGNRDLGQRDPRGQHQAGGTGAMAANIPYSTVELSRCRGIGDRCKVGRSAGMITVRRDAVRTQGRTPKAGGDQRDHEAVGSSSRLEAHAEVVKCDISATANTLK